MFQFPGFASHTYGFSVRYSGFPEWVSPFGHPRITARLTAPRGLSQPPTSFFGSWCQGIHHAPFVRFHECFFICHLNFSPKARFSTCPEGPSISFCSPRIPTGHSRGEPTNTALNPSHQIRPNPHPQWTIPPGAP